MQPEEEISELEITLVENHSVLTTSKVFKPLKVFQLKKLKCCQIVFSNYGGGFVEGDVINLKIDCGNKTTTVFSSQANSRVYKAISGIAARQSIKAVIGKDAFVAYLSDPIVPQKDSVFEQKYEWIIKEGGSLLLVDWFSAGRILNAERFNFSSFKTEFKVLIDDMPVVWDSFQIYPELTNLNSPGAFLNHSSYLNIFLVGKENLEKVKFLENHLSVLAKKHFQDEKPLQLNKVNFLGTAVKVNEYCFLVRCSAVDNEILQDFIKDLSLILENESLLGFNPLVRKF